TDMLWGTRPLTELPAVLRSTFGEREQRFVAASERAVARSRRLRWLMAALGLAITAVVLAVLVSLDQKSRERLQALYEEEGRQAMLSGDPMRALVYLAEAYRDGARTTPLRFLLAQAFRELGSLEVSLRGHRGRIWSVAFSPDGSRVVTAGD